MQDKERRAGEEDRDERAREKRGRAARTEPDSWEGPGSSSFHRHLSGPSAASWRDNGVNKNAVDLLRR